VAPSTTAHQQQYYSCQSPAGEYTTELWSSLIMWVLSSNFGSVASSISCMYFSTRSILMKNVGFQFSPLQFCPFIFIDEVAGNWCRIRGDLAWFFWTTRMLYFGLPCIN
jgi:hypothetical protein